MAELDSNTVIFSFRLTPNNKNHAITRISPELDQEVRQATKDYGFMSFSDFGRTALRFYVAYLRGDFLDKEQEGFPR